jgi:hypothetical protein
MLFSTVLNLFFIPVLYVIVKTMLTSLSPQKADKLEELAEVA